MSDQLIAEASGRAFLGVISIVKQRFGTDALATILANTDDATRRTFSAPFVGRRWYPYPAYAALLRGIEKTYGKNDGKLARELGLAAGVRDLGSIFKLYVMMSSAERLIRSCEKIWPVYYRNAGKMQALAWAPERTVLRITDFKHMDPLHCELMAGWMISTMAQIGCRVNDDGHESACMSKGAAYHEFVSSWTPLKR